MWIAFRAWIHHLFNPHCPHCEDLKLDSNICQSCEVLKKELELAHYENNRLLDSILHKNVPEQVPEIEEFKPLKRHVPWSTMRQQLEEQERVRAAQIRASKEREIEQTVPINLNEKVTKNPPNEIVDSRIEDLEKELLGADNAS